MFEEESLSINTVNLIIICILYLFCAVAVGIISKQLKLRFAIGFVWSIVFTPIIGLLLVYKYNPLKKGLGKSVEQE
jgi:hypothetical protein